MDSDVAGCRYTCGCIVQALEDGLVGLWCLVLSDREVIVNVGRKPVYGNADGMVKAYSAMIYPAMILLLRFVQKACGVAALPRMEACT